MIRIVRVPRSHYRSLAGIDPALPNTVQALNAAIDRLVGMVRGKVPDAALSIFARPKEAAGDYIDWLTGLEGHPTALTSLEEAQQRTSRTLLDERLLLISQALDGIAAREPNKAQAIAALRPLLKPPADDSVFVLNGEPVMTFWSPPRPEMVPPASPPPPAKEPPPPPPVEKEPQRKRRLWPWLLFLLLLLLLAALLCWLWLCPKAKTILPHKQPPAAHQTERVRQAMDAADCDELARLMKKEPLLQDTTDPTGLGQIAARRMAACQIQGLKSRIQEAKRCSCEKLEEIRVHDPTLQAGGQGGEIDAIRAQLDQSLAECHQALQPPPCPPARSPEQAPEAVLVFDASGSMNWNINMTYEQSYQLQMQLDALEEAGKPPPPVQVTENSRITVARKASRMVVQSLPADVPVGLVLVQECPAAKQVGFYKPEERTTMLEQIDHIEAVSGTPLGDGVRRAATMMDGVNRDALMVVLSDGRDTCGVDPCAEAQALAKSKPRLKINVVDLQGNGAARCLADATGGQFFAAKNAEQVMQFMREAARATTQEAIPAHCKNY